MTDDTAPTENDPAPPAFIEGGTREFRRVNLAMLAAGFSTFALMYCVQPLMPVFSEEFGVSAASATPSAAAFWRTSRMNRFGSASPAFLAWPRSAWLALLRRLSRKPSWTAW